MSVKSHVTHVNNQMTLEQQSKHVSEQKNLNKHKSISMTLNNPETHTNNQLGQIGKSKSTGTLDV